jgi:hypothetical protein
MSLYIYQLIQPLIRKLLVWGWWFVVQIFVYCNIMQVDWEDHYFENKGKGIVKKIWQKACNFVLSV